MPLLEWPGARVDLEIKLWICVWGVLCAGGVGGSRSGRGEGLGEAGTLEADSGVGEGVAWEVLGTWDAGDLGWRGCSC